MRKFVFALLLCGFSASLASPTCDDSEANKCSSASVMDKYPKTEEELKKFCSAILPELDCQLRFVQRCPKTVLAAFHVSLRMSRVLYGKICVEDNSLRAMFLRKSACLEREEQVIESRCSEKFADQDFCQKIDPVQTCIREDLNGHCGEDGNELYSEFEKVKRAMLQVFCMKE